jgi:IS30 family transposase
VENKQTYKHLTLEEREILYKHKALGYTYRKIGKLLGRSHTTLSREYRRNAKYGQEYIPCRAHNKAVKRGQDQRWKAPLKSPEILLFVREKLRESKSPEIISGLLRLQNDANKKISPEVIYQYIYHKDNRKDNFAQYLPLKRKKRMKKGERKVRRGKIPNSISIEQRPKEISLRNRYGDWESDLMEGNKADKQVILVSIERKSRYIKLTRLPNKESKKYMQAQVNQMQYLPVLTITSDNGLENVNHQEVSQKLNANYYFCHAYSSWEKGSVENVIKLIRRFVPKGERISKYTDEQIQRIENFINNYPRKLHNYLTPKQILEKEGIKI